MSKKNLWKKITTVLAITAVTIAGVTGCANSSGTQTEKAEENTNGNFKEFRIGCADATNNQLIDLGAVAQLNGYLEEELNKVGYTAKVIGFAGAGPEINAALMSGSLEAANYGEFPALTSKASGSDTTVIGISDSKLFYGILAGLKDIKTVKDLEGKKIVVQQGTPLQYAWEQIAQEAGIDTDKVEVINSNVADGMSLLQTKDADAVLSTLNSVENYEKKGIGYVVEQEKPVYSSTVFNISNKILKEEPQVAVAVNKALIRTYEEVIQNSQTLYDILGEKYGENGADIIQQTYTVDGSLDYLTPEFTNEFTDYIDQTYKWMKDNSIISGEVNTKEFFDGSYYEQAVKELAK